MTHLVALYAREVKRFQKLWLDTVLSPIVTVVLYLAVFGVIVGNQNIGQVPFLLFVYTGLLTMMLVMGSFSNPAFALVIGKNVGNIIDLQITPLKPWQVGTAYAAAALTRALVTIAVTLLLTAWLIPWTGTMNIPLALGAAVLSGLQFGLLGVVFGMFAKNFESLTFITQFVMQPMIFLAGIFYPLSHLPAPWSTVSLFNPLHHNVNIMRYAMTGYADTSPLVSLAVVAGLCLVLFVAMHFVTKRKLQAE